MSHRFAFTALLSCLLLLSANTALAQKDGKKKSSKPRDRFSVTASEEQFILTETHTGKTWLLAHPAGDSGGPVWLPVDRIDNADEAMDWRHKQRAVERELEEIEHRKIEEREHFDRAEHRERERKDLHRHLEELQIHRDRVTDEHGEKHPQTRELTREMERIERRLHELDDEAHRHSHDDRHTHGRHHPPGDDPHANHDQDTLLHYLQMKLSVLEKNRQELIAEGEDNQPSLEQINRVIEELRDQIERARREGDDRHGHNTDELRHQAAERRDDLQVRAQQARQRINAARHEAVSQQLSAVQQQLQQLRASHSSEHPAVKSLEKQIDLLRGHQKKRPERERSEQSEESEIDEHKQEHTADVAELLTDAIGKLTEQLDAARQSDDTNKMKHLQKLLDSVRAKQKTIQQRPKEHSEPAYPELAPLLIEEELLLETHGPLHPKVQAIRKKIEIMRRLRVDQERQAQERQREDKADNDDRGVSPSRRDRLQERFEDFEERLGNEVIDFLERALDELTDDRD